MNTPLFFTFFISLAISMASVPLLRGISCRFGFFDHPGKRHVHSVPIPRVGGIAIAFGALVPIFFWLPLGKTAVAYLAGALILLFMGLWDDLAPLHYKIKFAGQLLAAAIVVFSGGVVLEHLPFRMETMMPQWLSSVLTVFFFLGTTNAVNFSDGLDGLAGGLSLLSFGGIAFLSYFVGETAMVVIAISMMGAIYGFLRFNTHPANIFMGDGGSQFLGFTLCTLATMLTQTSRGDYGMGLCLLVLGLPLMDTIGVMIQRLIGGRSPFLADNKHIHHKLLTAGFFHSEAVMIAYFVQSVLLFLAYLLHLEKERVIWGVYGVFAVPVLLLFVLSAFSGLDWCRLSRDGRESFLRSFKIWVNKRHWLKERPLQILEAMLFLFLGLSAWVPLDVSSDFSVIAMILFVVVLSGMTLLREAAPFLIRVGLYIGSTFIVYLSRHTSFLIDSPIGTTLNLFFYLIAGLVVFNGLLQLFRETRFRVTPLDFLIIACAIFASMVPEIRMAGAEIGPFAAKLITLFFAYELVLDRFSNRIFRFGFVLLWLFLAITIRGWLI